MAFAHLHVHSRYSVCDGVADIYALFKRARSLGQTGLALTDHGALYGVPEFLETAQMFPDIKPVVGCEIWLTDHYDHKIKDIFHRKCFHLTLLAKNLAGYRNLVKIVTLGNIEGEFYAKPRISHEVLAAHHEGLIALSGCIAGEIPQAVLHDDLDKAVAAIEWYREVFGDDFYLEVMSHKLSKSGKGHNLKEMQDKVNAEIFDLAGKYGVDVVATNDVHFVLKKDAVLQDVMFKEYLYKGEKYSPLYTGEEYLKSEKQMLELFPDHPEAISNTMKVLDKVERYRIVSPPELPDYPVPDGYSQDGFLHRLCMDALERKGSNDTAHRSRLEYELKATEERGYANYFLLLWDLVKEVRRNGGLVASCGAIESSLINYLLDIATFDPVEFGVTERFIDVYDDFGGGLTFDTGGYQYAIDYIVKKYGKDFLLYNDTIIWGPTTVWLETGNIMNLIKDVTEECNIDYLTISLDDKKTFALFSECKMEEFYGFGNKKTRAILSDLQPVTFRELILSDNLFCLSENKCKEFLSRYHEKTEVSFPLPGISDILKDTYGVVVYVEQLEQIFHRVAGFTSDEIEHIINKGLSNKEFLEMKQLFIKRGIANGYSECELERFWDEENSSGDFVYPHCDRYLWLPESLSSTYLAYISSYLKAHFPETYQNHRKKYPDHL